MIQQPYKIALQAMKEQASAADIMLTDKIEKQKTAEEIKKRLKDAQALMYQHKKECSEIVRIAKLTGFSVSVITEELLADFLSETP